MEHSKKIMSTLAIGLLALIMFSFLILLIWWIVPTLTVTPRERMQNELAKELGVKIKDYPYPYSFPSGYFSTVLKPGMSIQEVHEIVQGYEQVLHCENREEVYYYLSVELEDTERFWIFYDEEGKYEGLQTEDNDSGRFSTNGCFPGLIEE
ncbi:MAG TPA: hypothetical protein VFG81_20320 [Anaerolineales bacterium]|jgi:hypothetical protein|nr:hypothetical protein [Anaerolineales bacterium]